MSGSRIITLTPVAFSLDGRGVIILGFIGDARGDWYFGAVAIDFNIIGWGSLHRGATIDLIFRDVPNVTEDFLDVGRLR